MKVIKKIMALILVALMAASLTACLHKKNEVAVTVGEYEFTSAYYMCALINARGEGESKVEEALTEEEQSSGEEIDYSSKKIDKKDFNTWVKDRAIEILKTHSAYKSLCEKNKIEFTEEEKTNMQQNAEYLWTYGQDGSGSSAAGLVYEPNGVSFETYLKYFESEALSEKYFLYLYGEEGTKAIKASDVKKQILDTYILVNVVESAYDEGLTDKEKKARKELMELNAEKIEKGEMTFEDVYKQFNNDEDSHDHSEEETKPVYEHASLMSAENSTYYEIFKKYKIDKPMVFEMENDSGVALVIKRNLSKDKYYLEQVDTTARHALKDEEFEKEIKAAASKLKADINKYAINQFKVDKIEFPETQTTA